MREPLKVAKDLQRVAEGRLAGRRALNVLARAVAELAGVDRPSYALDPRLRPDCIVEIKKSQKRARRIVRDCDRHGYSVRELFDELLLLRVALERNAIDEPLLEKNERKYRHEINLIRIAVIQTYLSRLVGIPCEDGLDILEKELAHPAMKKTISRMPG